MGNPYAPKGPTRHSNERRNPVDEFADRLVALGADRDEVDDWLDEVDLDSAEFERVRRMSDAEIRFHLEAVSGEEDDDEALDDASPILGAEGNMTASPPSIPQEPAEEETVDVPAGLVDQNVPEILAWVGEDPQRAAVALELESLTEKPRKTLVEPLQEIAGDAAG